MKRRLTFLRTLLRVMVLRRQPWVSATQDLADNVEDLLFWTPQLTQAGHSGRCAPCGSSSLSIRAQRVLARWPLFRRRFG